MPAGQRSSTPTLHREIWQAATAYIDGRLAHGLTVEHVARAALTSERQLQRIFAAEGVTVRSYIAQARMRRAAELALGTDALVVDIAGHVGYAHASAFIKAFRSFHGMTPSELRRRHRRM